MSPIQSLNQYVARIHTVHHITFFPTYDIVSVSFYFIHFVLIWKLLENDRSHMKRIIIWMILFIRLFQLNRFGYKIELLLISIAKRGTDTFLSVSSMWYLYFISYQSIIYTVLRISFHSFSFSINSSFQEYR